MHQRIGPVIHRDAGGRLVIADHDHQRRIGGMAQRIVHDRGQAVVHGLAIGAPNPVAIAPHGLGRIAGRGHAVKDPTIAQTVPVQQARNRHPGRMGRDQRDLREQAGAVRPGAQQPVGGVQRELVGHRHPVEGLAAIAQIARGQDPVKAHGRAFGPGARDGGHHRRRPESDSAPWRGVGAPTLGKVRA
ncbi:hypothetical protein EYF88_00005 [Paracoccus sediminis]|uniref:Uncharacterized protein n=1 Tax=Paracoccus sediminis TaxID=1214787 RepID=A0ABY1YNS0_9RHOB|nr:hypothetical protein [Paracoccus sediminis]TBN52638.1 hypothetical protein EYF88_00005 [Paracoccus sediminis]